MNSEQETRTFLLKARCVDEYADDVDLAVIDVPRSGVRDLIEKLEAVRRLKADMDGLASLMFWDDVDFYSSSRLEEHLSERLEEEGLLFLEADPCKDHDVVLTDCSALTVMENGAYWGAYLKHTGIRVETEWLDPQRLEELLAESDWWEPRTGAPDADGSGTENAGGSAAG